MATKQHLDRWQARIEMAYSDDEMENKVKKREKEKMGREPTNILLNQYILLN